MNRVSEHWTRGGTGLTNFPPEDFPRYRETVARLGSVHFEVSEGRMTGLGSRAPGGSLHYLGDIHSEEGRQEISRFWMVFEDVKKEIAA